MSKPEVKYVAPTQATINYYDKNGTVLKEGDVLVYQPSSVLNPRQTCGIDLVVSSNGELCSQQQVIEKITGATSSWQNCSAVYGMLPLSHYPMLTTQKQIRAVTVIGNIKNEEGKSMITPEYAKKLFGVKTKKKS